MRDKAEITDREYNDFYKTISKDTQDPLSSTHFSAEGEIEFKSILYVPGEAPQNLYENYYGKSSALKLYVRRVLIAEEFDELMPQYLSFVKGVVDSDDLPLNVSREQLQQMKMIKVMSKKLVRKTIDMIRALAEEDEEDDDEGEDGDDNEGEDADDDDASKEDKDEEDKDEDKEDKDDDQEKKGESKYITFWKNYSKNIKLGVIEDASNRNKLAKLLRFHSTKDPEGWTSLEEYISRMKDNQDTILFLPGETTDAILESPILKKYVKKGYEVLLLSDSIDEFCVQHLSEYERRKIKSIAKDDVSLLDGDDETSKKKLQKLKEMYKPLTDWWKEFLGKDVEKVTISNKLDDDPLFILTSQYGFSATMERVNRAQAFHNQDKAAGYMMAKKNLEINPHHSIMKTMLETIKGLGESEKVGAETEDHARLLWNMALLNSGFTIDNPATFTGPLARVLHSGFGLARDEPVEEIEVEIEDDEEEPAAEETAQEPDEEINLDAEDQPDEPEVEESSQPHEEL